MIESLFHSWGSENVSLSACVSIFWRTSMKTYSSQWHPILHTPLHYPWSLKTKESQTLQRKEKRNPRKQAIHGSSGSVEAHPRAFLCCRMFGSCTFHSCQGCQILRSVFYFSWLPSYQSSGSENWNLWFLFHKRVWGCVTVPLNLLPFFMFIFWIVAGCRV